MSDPPTPYTVSIHGAVYGLAVGDQAAAAAGTQDLQRVQAQPPFMTPHLPPQGVVGRDGELTQIFDFLVLDDEQATNIPPLALRGMGGIGKTTLAMTLGRLEIIPTLFPDGVLWTALGPNPTIRILLDNWGKALGIDLLAERDENACRERLQAFLYQRRALIIMDDVWQEKHASYFLVGGPRCRTLITTRETPVAHALSTRKRTLRVDLLSPAASLVLLRRLAPEWVAADEQTARLLCERLEFLPLALTLAGRMVANEADVPGQMQRLVNELIERREARLKLLQMEGRPGLTEEPVSLQAILGMSVEQLSQIDQERFAMLGVFDGEPLTWDVDAVAYVWECSIEEAEAVISRFVQRGLVERRGNRYWTHGLLADFAVEMMEKTGL